MSEYSETISDSKPALAEIQQYIERLQTELFQSVLPFWFNHSNDDENGGFFTCLTRKGEIYDRRKFMWLNGRQIWMFSKICSQYSSEEIASLSLGKLDRDRMLQMAIAAADFNVKHGIRDDEKVYFSLAEDGKPHTFQRKIFSACFLCLGCAGLFGATKTERFRIDCIRLLDTVIDLIRHPSKLGRPVCDGAPESSPLNIPMILLNLLDEVIAAGISITEVHVQMQSWAILEILKHVKEDKKLVFENVGPNGELLPGYDGRHLNPGHAIEAGWFVLQYAQSHERQDLKELAMNMMEWSFELGWDHEVPEGGIIYFLDSEGYCPPYLEWDMKLWWPHNEAMIAFAMAVDEEVNLMSNSASSARSDKCSYYWKNFCQVTEYSLAHFSDAANGGEWFGYLNRKGEKTHSFKGGPYKGCFHVPRALLFCLNILNKLKNKL